MFELKKNEKGFALIEFIIALPLIILLLYGFGQTTMKTFETSNNHAADYELEVEAQEVLTQIVQDARAASYVKREPFLGNENIDTLIIKYHGTSTFYYENNKKRANDAKIFDIIDHRVYTVAQTDEHGLYVYAQRQEGYHSSPITGGSTFGDTSVIKFKFRKIGDNVLHITLEMKSNVTNQHINLSTAVYMPACKKMDGFLNE